MKYAYTIKIEFLTGNKFFDGTYEVGNFIEKRTNNPDTAYKLIEKAYIDYPLEDRSGRLRVYLNGERI